MFSAPLRELLLGCTSSGMKLFASISNRVLPQCTLIIEFLYFHFLPEQARYPHRRSPTRRVVLGYDPSFSDTSRKMEGCMYSARESLQDGAADTREASIEAPSATITPLPAPSQRAILKHKASSTMASLAALRLANVQSRLRTNTKATSATIALLTPTAVSSAQASRSTAASKIGV